MIIANDGIISEFKGIQFETYNPKPEEVIVWTFNITNCDIETCQKVFEIIKDAFPNNKCIAIPDNAYLEVFNKDSIIQTLQEMIQYLEETK